MINKYCVTYIILTTFYIYKKTHRTYLRVSGSKTQETPLCVTALAALSFLNNFGRQRCHQCKWKPDGLFSSFFWRYCQEVR